MTTKSIIVMNDKVKKIREEVEKIAQSTNPFIPDEDGKNSDYEAGKLEAAIQILQIIDSLEEPVSEDLKEELNKYIKDHFTIDKEQLDRFGIDEKDYMYSMDKSDLLALVEHFTKWQKEQIMAKAKSGTVQNDNQVILDNGAYIDLDPSMQLKPSFVGLKEGNRIKVIVIKED